MMQTGTPAPQLSPPQIVRTAAQKTAVIHVVCPRSEIRNVMEPGIREVYAALRTQGIAPSGPWFTRHLRVDPQVFDFEISVPVASPVQPVGRVQPGELPAATVAQTVYRGPYEGLGEAWPAFKAWIREQGHQEAPGLWERYLTDPAQSPHPQDWLTELNQPLQHTAP